MKIWLAAMKLIEKIRRKPDDPAVTVTEQQLSCLCDGAYGSLMEFTMGTYLE